MSSRTLNNLTHKLSLYRHSSGALVFGAGTCQWSWGLDGEHWGGGTSVSAEMQQATVNLFADMGVQPGTLQAGLTQHLNPQISRFQQQPLHRLLMVHLFHPVQL
jgi:hypothetical protein